LRETSRCSARGEEHGCNVYSAQWFFWVRKHLGGLRKLKTIMGFDVNIWRSFNAINVSYITPNQNLQLST
jgi:hypothetical protein